ncbi:MAG: thiol:disulfide interchange protein TlpA [Neoaquamicrobium sediminum]|uniref:thiol:disulfide interchange protein TlpA n=1 Tax=Neoaquamicrobium sediminum TaxID=1849104 RepID=UPI004034FA48
MANGKFHLPTGRLITLAIVAGVTVGAIGVYVMGAPSGNNPQQVASLDADTAACQAKAETLEAVDAAARGEVAAILAANPPQSVKDLAFNAPDGSPMALADLSGKTLLVNLWATWCAPCREEMPALNQLQKDMGSDTFEVVAVNVDTGGDEKPKRFLEETKVDALGYYRDSTLGLFNELKRRGLALGLPVTLLVDDEGCMIGHMNGPAEWASDDAKRLIEAAM